MKIIDNNIHNALLKYRETFQTQRAMADALNLSPGQIGRLLHRQVSHFDDATWKRIEPCLEPYLNLPCAQGYIKCPLANKDLEKLLKNILEINDPEWYNIINKCVEEQKTIYLKSHLK